MKRIFITILLLILIVFLAIGLSKQFKKTYSLNKAIDELEEKLTNTESENKNLKANIDSFQDPKTIDREARERLNLKKEGEEVVIIIPSEKEVSPDIIHTTSESSSKSFWNSIKNWFGGVGSQ